MGNLYVMWWLRKSIGPFFRRWWLKVSGDGHIKLWKVPIEMTKVAFPSRDSNHSTHNYKERWFHLNGQQAIVIRQKKIKTLSLMFKWKQMRWHSLNDFQVDIIIHLWPRRFNIIYRGPSVRVENKRLRNDTRGDFKWFGSTGF